MVLRQLRPKRAITHTPSLFKIWGLGDIIFFGTITLRKLFPPFPLAARAFKIGECFFLQKNKIRNISPKDTFETLKYQNFCLQGVQISHNYLACENKISALVIYELNLSIVNDFLSCPVHFWRTSMLEYQYSLRTQISQPGELASLVFTRSILARLRPTVPASLINNLFHFLRKPDFFWTFIFVIIQ